jgi:hypothetical protein
VENLNFLDNKIVTAQDMQEEIKERIKIMGNFYQFYRDMYRG